MSTKRRGSAYECVSCGAPASRWLGRCPGCGGWGTVEQVPDGLGPGTARRSEPGAGRRRDHVPARPITEVPADPVRARPSGIVELDRVLGGGLVPGSVVLLAGEPGVGKSTLLLEVAGAVAAAGRRVLYLTGEESAGAVRARAGRVGAEAEGLWLAQARLLSEVADGCESARPDLIIVDSVQTLQADDVDGAAGSVTQVRAVAEGVGAMARATGATALLVGHVTKDGALAGPRTLEHLVDVVCMLEGDRHARLRMLRAVKNRYGPTDEVGCFELGEDGMREVSDPSGLFLSGSGSPAPGACVTVSVEGRRPLTIEVQTLVVPASGSPRRVTSGLDSSRVAMILAVLDRRGRVQVPPADVYAATVGGLRVSEPAVDLAVALSLASAVRDEPVPAGLVAVGELGLGGEVRDVAALPRRLAEAARLGFRVALVPPGGSRSAPAGLRAVEVSTLVEALAAGHDEREAARRVVHVPDGRGDCAPGSRSGLAETAVAPRGRGHR